MSAAQPLIVYLPDTRGVKLARYGSGNAKIGFGVFTYSRLPGQRNHQPSFKGLDTTSSTDGTCPGATRECEEICYAKRVTQENGPVSNVWLMNSLRDDVPPIPPDCKVLRFHVSGDFDSVQYIEQWIARLTERPDVTAWGYTKSWRVPELCPQLERLRALPNVQLFASMDASASDDPNVGILAMPMRAQGLPDWRRAWIYRQFDQAVKSGLRMEDRLTTLPEALIYSKQNGLNHTHHAWTHDGDKTSSTPSYVCPEETGYKKNCLECGYCFEGKKNDVTFLEH